MKSRYARILIIMGTVTVFLIAALFFYVWFINPYAGIGGGAAHVYNQRSGDRDRDRDLGTIRLSLELYADKFGSYPISLDKLVSEKLLTEENTKDPVTKNTYTYSSSADGKNYVLTIQYGVVPENIILDRHLEKARDNAISGRLNSSLDLDGEVYGINCDDPIFCVSSVFQ